MRTRPAITTERARNGRYTARARAVVMSLALAFAAALSMSAPLFVGAAEAQTADSSSDSATGPASDPTTAATQKAPSKTVEVKPTAKDGDIAARLTAIMKSTDWYKNPSAKVNEGVVFLSGTTDTAAKQKWAAELAQKTRDVVAVVNRIKIDQGSAWDFTPAFAEINQMIHNFIQMIPHLVLAVIILVVSWFASGIAYRLAMRYFSKRVDSGLLSNVLARTISFPVFLIGIYIVLQLSGLTRLALTVLGGTGVIGIIFGFAFRDIAENFLASIILSVRRPFLPNDLIKVDDNVGIVRNMNTRTTILMTSDGNNVQIPNATVFKSIITNYTANPNSRDSFTMSVGYDNSISDAQNIIAKVLDEQDQVLTDPAPMILVEDLATSAAILRIYYWYNSAETSGLKLKSFLMRRSLRALDEAGIGAPDSDREIIFPKGLTIIDRATSSDSATVSTQAAPGVVTPHPAMARADSTADGQKEPPPHETEDKSSFSEGGLESEQDVLEEQAKLTRPIEEGSDLLEKPEKKSA